MRAHLLAALAAITLLAVPTGARATCSANWTYGPFWKDFVVNGANFIISNETAWDPDGAGPLPGELVVQGTFSSIQGVPAPGLAMLNPNTGVWTAIPSPAAGQINAICVYNGQLVVAGTFTSSGSPVENSIAAFDGTSWHALGGGITFSTYVRALTVWNGQLIAGGQFNTADGSPALNIASWDGSAWHPLGSGVTGSYVTALTVWNGNLVAGGVFNHAGGVAVNNVATWNGSSWSAMGSGEIGGFAGFQPYLGQLYAAIQTTVSGTPASYVGAWNGTSWSNGPTFTNYSFEGLGTDGANLYTVGSQTGNGNGLFRYDGALHNVGGGLNGTSYDFKYFNGDMIAVGLFTQADGRSANRIARWDGTNWGTFGGGTSTSVNAFVNYNGRIVAGGDFHQSLKTGPEAHDVVGVANGTLSPLGSGMDDVVDALYSYTTGTIANRSFNLVAGGSFVHADGVVVGNVARWTEKSVNIFPGPSWTAMGSGFDGQVDALERFGNQVFAGGTFAHSGAVGVSDIARYNETSQAWEAFGAGGMNGPVYALKLFGSSLYAGGAFTTAGGVATGGLARWDGTTWSAVGGSFAGTVYALEVHGGQLVIGGSYPGIGGSPNLAQYNGTSYSTLGTGGTNAVVRSLHSTGARLYVGGDFTSLGGLGINRLGYWDGSWHDSDGGVDNSVYAITNHNNLVNAGGIFNNVQGGAFVGTPTWALFDETGVPKFWSQPFSVNISGGETVSFTAVPDTGYTVLSLQWYRGITALVNGPTGTGSTISGASSEVLNIANVGSADLGGYSMVVSVGCGSDTSAVATLGANTGVGGTGLEATRFLGVSPNPAPGTARCDFALARAARVKLTVHDVAGREVRTVDLGQLAAGPHGAAWDARDAGGSRVRAGVYFVGLDVDGRGIGTRRLAIVR